MVLRNALWCGVAGLGLASGLLTTAGCASETEKARESGMSAAEDFRDEVKKFNPQLDKVNASLNKLIAGNTTDRYSAYTAYNQNVAVMEDNAQRLRKEAAAMQADAAKYFEAWDRQLDKTKGTANRAAGEETRQAGKNRWEQVREYLARADTDYRASLDNYRSIRETLKGNLTNDAVKSVMPAVERSSKDSTDLHNVLDALGNTIDAAVKQKK